jgi:hypothetical protein
LSKSNPVNLRFLYFSSGFSYDVVCKTNSLANKSVASKAALRANYLGIIYNASANSAITVKSLAVDL